MPTTVLVADDDAAWRAFVAELLTDEGYAVVQAPDGAAAPYSRQGVPSPFLAAAADTSRHTKHGGGPWPGPRFRFNAYWASGRRRQTSLPDAQHLPRVSSRRESAFNLP